MSSEWRKVRLGDYISLKGGLSYKGEFIGTGDSILVGMGAVSYSERFLLSGTKSYGGDFSETHRLLPNDIVIATRQQSDILPILGFPAIVPAALRGRNVMAATNLYKVTNHSEINNNFLFWLLRGNDYRRHILSCAKGTTVRMLTKDAIEDFEFNCPAAKEREAMSNFLDSLDDRITLLRETNATLEAIAQAMFKSWFVDFDPVHAKQQGRVPEGMDEATAALFPDSFEESELGLVPKGWKVGLLGETLKIAYGKNLPTNKLLDSGYPVFGGNGQIGFSDKYLYETRQVLVSCRGAASGKVNQSPPRTFVTNNSLVLESNEFTLLPFGYLKGYMHRSDLIPFVTGSAQPQVTIDNLKNFKILVPTSSLLKAFEILSTVIEDRLEENNIQAQTFSTLRDTLLPRLISGQLRLPEAEVMLKDVA